MEVGDNAALEGKDTGTRSVSLARGVSQLRCGGQERGESVRHPW